MLNDIDFDYIDLGLPNLVWAKSKEKTYSKPVQLGSRMAPLAYEAAKKFPRWKFVGLPSISYDDQMEVAKFNVYENREKIGTIGTTQTRQGLKYVIANDRIAKGRKRGSSAETKDVSKALKLMAKSFGGKTNTEKLNAAYAELERGIINGNAAKQAAFNQSRATLVRRLDPYIFANFETVSAAAIAAGADANGVMELPELKNDLDTTSHIYHALANTKGVFIHITGNDYLTRDGLDNLVLSSDQLPSDLKGKLGMLKLVEDNHFMKDVGYRLNANTFFIVRGEP